MFRSAATRQSELATHRLAVHMDSLTRSANDWFNGTPESIDTRIAKLDHVIAFARDTAGRLASTEAGRHAVVTIQDLEQDRRELAAARDSLLNGFSDRQATASALAGRRTASSCPECGQHLHDEYARLGHGHDPDTGEVFNAPPQYGHEGLGDYQKRFRSSLQRAVTLGSRDFVASQNTDDRDELIHRAHRYAAEQTSTLPVPAARAITAAFMGKVEELIARRPRKRQAAQIMQATHYEDFDDQLMY